MSSAADDLLLSWSLKIQEEKTGDNMYSKGNHNEDEITITSVYVHVRVEGSCEG